MSDIRFGVIGVGSMGVNHARIASDTKGAALAGVFDVDGARAEEIATRFGTQAFATQDELIASCDAVVIATPTTYHAESANRAIDAGRHLLVEKPLAPSSAEARALVTAAEAAGLVALVGHVERFNPAVGVLKAACEGRHIRGMRFQRLSSYTPQSSDVDVVFDLTIHDIDLMRAISDSPVVSVAATGHTIKGNRPDLVEALLTLDNGIFAGFTSSKASYAKVRSIEVHADDATIAANLLTREVITSRGIDDAYVGSPGAYRQSIMEERSFAAPIEPLRAQLVSFMNAVKGVSEPVVTFADGAIAVELAEKIVEEVGHP